MIEINPDIISSGIELRRKGVTGWLRKRGFKGEYLLVSTKEGVKGQRSEIRGGRLIVDLYTPLMLEKQVSFRWWNPLAWRVRQISINNIKSYLLAGDHFLVANRRQRGYWLKTAKDLDIHLKENDISVLPTGAGYEPRATSHEPRAGQPKVVLWFGGIYPWMNPWPLVEAFGRLARKFPDWKLRFLGGWQPGTGYEKSYLKIKKLAEKIIPGYQVEFIPWQAQEKLSMYLADVGLAVHLAKSAPEDYYAHRVRLLTLTNAGIPVVTSGEDVISDLIVKIGSGKKVVNDAGEIEAAIRRLLKSTKTVRSLSQRTGKIEQLYFRQETDMDDLEKFL